MDGLENLGTGLLQGYQFGLQQKRLQKADERQAVQDAALAKSQELQNRTNEFNLQSAQTKQGWSEEDHLKNEKINQYVNQAVVFKTGNDLPSAFKTLTDGVNDPVFGNKYKTEFLGLVDGKDPDTGQPAKLGKIRYINADGSVMGEADMPIEKATVMFAHSRDAAANMDKEREQKIAAQTKATDRKNTLADSKDLATHKALLDAKAEAQKADREWNKLVLQYGDKKNNLTSNGRALLQTPTEEDDGYGGKKTTYRLDNNKAIAFFKYAKANGLKANDETAQEWMANDMPGLEQGGGGGGDNTDPNALAKVKVETLQDPKVKAVINDVDLSQAKPSSNPSKPSAVKESKPNPEKPKPKPAQQGKGNAGSKTPQEYVQSLANALPVMPPPKTYPKGTTFFSRDAGNPLDRTQKVGTR